MKNKVEFEQLKKLEIKDLLKTRKSLELDFIKEKSASMSASGKKGNSLSSLRKKIAWVETLISQKLILEGEKIGE
jgi:ribosomal protein L29